MDLSRRVPPHSLPEWMDGDCDEKTFKATLRDLAAVNRILLAMRPVLRFLAPFAGETLHILDVGSGGGDAMRAVARWAWRTGTPVQLTGVDLNPHAAVAAREFTAEAALRATHPALAAMLRRIEFVTADVFSFEPTAPVDLTMASLMTHHLEDEEIVRLIGWMEATARHGWLVNDLHRGRWSVHGFSALAWAMRWHPFVRHDGPVSVRRAFQPEDWRGYLQAAGVEGAAIEPWRPGRLCVRRVRF